MFKLFMDWQSDSGSELTDLAFLFTVDGYVLSKTAGLFPVFTKGFNKVKTLSVFQIM